MAACEMSTKILQILICVFLILPHFIVAQKSNFQSGARSEGMGHASITLNDPWAVFNNIGALSGSEAFSMGFSYKSQFSVEGFNTAALCMNLPFKQANIGVGARRFGDAIFNETKVCAGIAQSIGIVGLGVNVNYLQYNVSGFGASSALVIELGGVARLFPGLTLAAHLFNVNNARLSGREDYPVPYFMQAGIAYQPDQNLTVSIEIEKEPYFDPSLKAGFEYAILDQLLVRTGFSTFPQQGHFGIGFKNPRFDIDFSIASHRELGVAQQLGINYKILK